MDISCFFSNSISAWTLYISSCDWFGIFPFKIQTFIINLSFVFSIQVINADWEEHIFKYWKCNWIVIVVWTCFIWKSKVIIFIISIILDIKSSSSPVTTILINIIIHSEYSIPPWSSWKSNLNPEINCELFINRESNIIHEWVNSCIQYIRIISFVISFFFSQIHVVWAFVAFIQWLMGSIGTNINNYIWSYSLVYEFTCGSLITNCVTFAYNTVINLSTNAFTTTYFIIFIFASKTNTFWRTFRTFLILIAFEFFISENFRIKESNIFHFTIEVIIISIAYTSNHKVCLITASRTFLSCYSLWFSHFDCTTGIKYYSLVFSIFIINSCGYIVPFISCEITIWSSKSMTIWC